MFSIFLLLFCTARSNTVDEQVTDVPLNVRGRNWNTPQNYGENRNVIMEMIKWKVYLNLNFIFRFCAGKNSFYLVSKYRFVWVATTCSKESYSESIATIWMLLSI